MATGWDSGKLKKLKALIGKGLSTSEIGKKIGVSKNAVVGKLNRLGWNIKGSEESVGAEKKKSESKSASAKAGGKKVSSKAPAKSASTKAAQKSSNSKKTVRETKTTKSVRETKSAKKVNVKKSVEKNAKISKPAKAEKEPIKTASKKTKKDLALHELLIQHALQMANLKPNQCRWPIGDPDSDSFHFCGETVFSGKPYCYEHCRQAYQFTPPKKK